MVDAVTITLIQATLAPIFLVNGAAIFLNFTQARLFRVIDRLRVIAKEAAQEPPADRRQELARERGRHVRRALVLRNAILLGVLVIAFTVLTTLLILVSGLDPALASGRAAILALLAALASFLGALGLVTLDAFLSVASARHTVR